jgi:nuclease S1
VVHFVADVHQLLHCADNGDKAAMPSTSSSWGAAPIFMPCGILAFWQWRVRGDECAHARRLVRMITPGKLAWWQLGSSAQWANESYGTARQLIHGEWPHEPGPLPASYETAALPVASMQLEKAGVRLATLLNTALR